MSGPTGLIFAMRSRYKTNDGSEAFYDEVDTAFSGQNEGFDLTNGMTNGAMLVWVLPHSVVLTLQFSTLLVLLVHKLTTVLVRV